MKKNFRFIVLLSFVMSGLVLCQAGQASHQAAQAAFRKARDAQSPAQITEAYNQLQAIPPRLQAQYKDPAEQVLRQKAMPLGMAIPGVVRPAHVDQPTFDAISQTQQFKQLTVAQQNHVLNTLSAAIGGRAPGLVTAAEITATLGGGAIPAGLVAGVGAALQASLTHHGLLAVGGPLLAHGASGIADLNVYNVIIGPAAGPTTNVQKNNIMPLVAAAIAAHGGNQIARDNAITAAVGIHGNHAGFAAAIIAAVNAAHPIAAPPLACPAVTDADLLEELMNGLVTNITVAGTQWEIEPFSYNINGAVVGGAPSYISNGQPFLNYPGAVLPGFTPYAHTVLGPPPAGNNLILDPAAHGGGNAVVLTAPNTAAGQPFHGVNNAAGHIAAGHRACHYTAGPIAHGGNQIRLNVILVH